MKLQFALCFAALCLNLHAQELEWTAMPDLPNPVGVAGPFVGVHGDALIVAGGANFPDEPLWETDKAWHAQIHVLMRGEGELEWKVGGVLERPTAYGAAVSLPEGVLCMGGNDGAQTFDSCFLLAWDPEAREVTRTAWPGLPSPCAYGSAVVLGDRVYLAGGQSEAGLESAMKNFWRLDLSARESEERFAWEELEAWPGPERAFNIAATQHDGFNDAVYVISGRRQEGEGIEFLRDVWQFTPATGTWKARAEAPRCVMAGTGIGWGQSHILVLGGADGSLFFQADALKDDHPGFPREALAYHTITDTWTSAGAMPTNQVTMIPVQWDGGIVLASGEVRPRVRTPKVWRVEPKGSSNAFGVVNYIVLAGYLLLVVCVGLYFTNKNKDTNDYFRGGKRMAWWAVGCSIFATMLSSLTFTGLPSKAFAQDWLYVAANFMIVAVAPIAVYVALPFFRRIDATSAYEYLERRFNRLVRLFASASFTLFHIFRMAVVMSLTAYALAAATPLTPTQSVLIMGVLSILYCTLGGIEAVIWTDMAQTVVLMGGALLILGLLLAKVGAGDFVETASAYDKFRMADVDFSSNSYMKAAIWVILIGAFGQNLSSYTADQAVVQRYMTTESEALAARSIWFNAALSIVATFLFFSIGTGLFVYYHEHPGRLDPTITTDQIFPYFIAREAPVGLAGLLVAGIFAAAQSTVSTSMNSIATTAVTDWLRPGGYLRTEGQYLWTARLLTILGTGFALVFIDPEIRSLFDAFIKVIGVFMGVLGGLFALGALTRRANGKGAFIGALFGAATMVMLWKFTRVNGFLYTVTGITSCFAVGYVSSFLFSGEEHEIEGLTIYRKN